MGNDDHDSNGLNDKEVRKLLEEEIARQNKWLDFAQKQVDEVRKWALFVLAIFGLSSAAIGAFGYKSLSDMKTETRSTIDGHVKIAMSELDDRVNRAFDAKLATEFDKPTIQRRIDDGIQQILKQRVEVLIHESLEPAEHKIETFRSLLEVHQLVLAVQSNDRLAYEELERKSEKLGPRDPLRTLVEMATAETRTRLEREMAIYNEGPEFRDVVTKPLDTILEIARADPSARRRVAAIQSIVDRKPDLAQVAGTLDHVLAKDKSLEAISRVIGLLRWLYQAEDLEAIDAKSARTWIEANRHKIFPK